MANSLLHSPDGTQSVVLPGHEGDGLVTNNANCNALLAKLTEQSQEIPKNLQQQPSEEKCDLKVQVIDDTALIEPSNQGKMVKLEKKPKRRVRKARRKKEASPLEKAGTPERRGKEGGGALLMYSRKEVEALRFECLEDQKRKWIEVYCGLDPLVAREYDGLLDSANNHHLKNYVPRFNFDPSPPIQKSANLCMVFYFSYMPYYSYSSSFGFP